MHCCLLVYASGFTETDICNKNLLYIAQGTLLMLCGSLDGRGVWGRM